MKKSEMIKEMIDCGCFALVISEYRAEGYTEEGAVYKTIDYYCSAMKKSEIKELYNDFIEERKRYYQ